MKWRSILLSNIVAVVLTTAVVLFCVHYYSGGRVLQAIEYEQVRLQPPSKSAERLVQKDNCPKNNFAPLNSKDVPPSKSAERLVQEDDDPMKNFVPLSSKDVNEVKVFLLFSGYQHSGHSILTAMLDAHPNIILSAKYELLRHWNKIKARVHGDKTSLFNEMYLHSVEQASKQIKKILKDRTQFSKDYSLFVPTLMQGKFTELRVIGDKSAGMFAAAYDESWPAMAKETYQSITKITGIPIKTVHLVRNPFDMIATHTILQVNHTFVRDNRWESGNKMSIELSTVMNTFDYYHNLSLGANTLQYDWQGEYDVLEVHYADFIHHPKEVLHQICDFIDVECSDGFLEECNKVVFGSVSKTRYLMEWQPEAMEAVEKLIKQHPFFGRYSFNSD